MSSKVLLVVLKIRKQLMLKSGRKNHSAVLFDNEAFLQTIKS